MRVEKTTSVTGGIKPVQKTATKGAISFAQLLGDREDDQQSQEQLKQMLKEIEQKGRQLVESRTVETLLEYKEMITGFVREAVEFGLRVQERRGNSRTGRSKMMKVVATIDDKLLELTDLVLTQEKSQITLLEKIGQLHGLLVNLYA